MVVEVVVPLDLELLRLYNTFKILKNPPPRFGRLVKEKMDEYRNKIGDHNVRKNMFHFYEALSNYCQIAQNTLDCSNAGKAIDAFQELLHNKTGQAYKIRLVADDNL